MGYPSFIHSKSQLDGNFGFEPYDIPAWMFGFQAALVEWSLRKGRGAIFADCGLGKSPMELVWANNVYRHTGKPTLLLTPLAVAEQFVDEAVKFNIEAARSVRGEIEAPVVIANYERLHHFSPADFGGVVCDESSILKSFDGVRRGQITEFMRLMKYRLLGTATAAPNDFTEVGTSSEALGYLGHVDMLHQFFTDKQKSDRTASGIYKEHDWRFKGHAEEHFWRWMTSWARSLRKPSDMGFPDDGFDLPPLTINEHLVDARNVTPGMLFNLPAVNMHEQRHERRRTLEERCERAAALVNGTGESATVWCSLNDEGDLLERLIPDAQQVSGRDSDDSKEEKFSNFTHGGSRVLITKPKIGAWGLNWQHCHHMTWFPTHSYEQYYQAVRRHWRFGQASEVRVDIVMTEGEREVQKNLQRKADQAEQMFTQLVKHMSDSMEVARKRQYDKPMEVPSWLF